VEKNRAEEVEEADEGEDGGGGLIGFPFYGARGRATRSCARVW